jgi:hypothetical protein
LALSPFAVPPDFSVVIAFEFWFVVSIGIALRPTAVITKA